MKQHLSSLGIRTGPTISFDTAGAAHYIGCSASYLNKARCVGGGPKFFRCGRRVRYVRSDLDDWIAEQRRSSTSDNGVIAA